MAWRFGQALGSTKLSGAIVSIENSKISSTRAGMTTARLSPDARATPSTTVGSDGGGAAGKIRSNEFTVTKEVDAASPSFFGLIAPNKNLRLPTVLIEEYGETDGTPHHTIKLTNATVVRVRPIPPKKGKACEEITFAFEEMQVDRMRTNRLPPWIVSSR